MSDHRLANGSFRNPWPDSEVAGLRNVLRVVWARLVSTASDAPWRGAFPASVPDVVHPRRRGDEFVATWIGHATVLLQVGGLNVLTDPVFCERAFPVQWFGPRRVMPPALTVDHLPPIDVVLVSHDHYDHLDRAAARRIAAANPSAQWVVPRGLGPLLRRWRIRGIVELDWGESARIQDLSVTAIPARHFSGRGIADRNRSLWCGYAMSINGWKGLFAGDTAYHDGYGAIGARLGPFDLVMIPIGAYAPRWFMHVVHVDPDEALQMFLDLSLTHTDAPLPLLLGIHWGTFRLTDEPMDEPPKRTLAAWRASNLDPRRLWIARFGETRSVGR